MSPLKNGTTETISQVLERKITEMPKNLSINFHSYQKTNMLQRLSKLKFCGPVRTLET